MSSNIRAFVSFGDKGAVFAGEDIECTITFRNIAPVPGSHSHRSTNSRSLNGYTHGSISEHGGPVNGYGERRTSKPPLQLAAAEKSSGRHSRPGSANAMAGGPLSGGLGRGHRPSLSLSMPGSARRTQSVTGTPVNVPVISASSPATTVRPMTATTVTEAAVATTPGTAGGHKHKRSISIVSIGSDAGGEGLPTRGSGRRSTPHSRSTSLSVVPKRSPNLNAPNGNTPTSATLPHRHRHHPSGPTHVIEESLTNFSVTSPRRSPTPRHAANGSLNRSFKFPPTPSAEGSTSASNRRSKERSPIAPKSHSTDSLSAPGITNIDLASPADESNSASEFEHVPPSNVINSQIMAEETPRSSIDFYSLPNSTTDTLMSDFDGRPSSRLRSPHSRKTSLLSGMASTRAPEILMMGYAQVQGSFMLDGSLVQTGSFEEIKRKGVVGGHMGGGVVGIESKRRDNGFLGGFGWGNISNGLGNGITNGLSGLLTGNGNSSIAGMKTIASSRSIPILSTPQSILFVDLKLAPGETKSYTYTFTLPRQLPPSHRGKAIKVVYNIVIGTQRPGKGVQPKVLEIPFRVFGHVNAVGGLHNYDLMNPIILLKDEAKVKATDEVITPITLNKTKSTSSKKPNKPESSLDEFLNYAEKLLQSHLQHAHTAAGGNMPLLSPSIISRRNSLVIPEQPSAKEAIDFAVMNVHGRPGASQIFGITRNGKQVANLSLARPAYKLGESIIAVIDFSNAQIPCYQVNATLETHESVAQNLALRSASSVYRVTRKVHAQYSENCLFSKRITFVPTIPQSGTPEFSTSGVSLTWCLRIEFISSHTNSHSNNGPSGGHSRVTSTVGNDVFDFPEEYPYKNEGLMERTHKDDRGQLFTATQHVWCDSFDCSIPVKVYANEIGSSGAGNHGGFVV